MKKDIQKRTKASKKSEEGANKNTRPGDHRKVKEKSFGEASLGDDYWERVADDAASGYKDKKDENRLLNEDQQPDDHTTGGQEKE
jgi:hypothetical protein